MREICTSGSVRPGAAASRRSGSPRPADIRERLARREHLANRTLPALEAHWAAIINQFLDDSSLRLGNEALA